MLSFKGLRFVLLSAFIALFLCAVAVTPALADGGDGKTSELESPPDPGTDPGTVPSTDPQSGEEDPGDVYSQETGTPGSGSGPEYGTDVTIAGDQEDAATADGIVLGEEPLAQPQIADDSALPAASDDTESEDPSITILMGIGPTGDPIWCPAAVATPLAGAAGCTASYSSLQDLLTYLTLHQPSVDGVIWLEKTFDSGTSDPGVTAFTLDGMVMSTMANYTLTIRGGWNGLGTKTIDINDPSEINARLEILSWKNDVTITGVELTGASMGSDTLYVTTSKKITLNRVKVVGNSLGGAQLDNTAGTSDVSVSNSQFNDNTGGFGLYIRSNGNITVNNTSAKGNHTAGTVLNNSSAATAKNITLTSGTYDFNDNVNNGLEILSTGQVSLKDITAVGNGGYGSWIDNSYSTSAGVTLSGTNVFSENGINGLYVYSKGIITASNIIANANAGNGAYLDNISAATPKSVTLTGTSEFKFNTLGGLWVNTAGAITLSNITASYSTTGFGGSLYNASPGSTYNVVLTGTNNFSFNASSGLFIASYGTISVSNLVACDNGWSGWGYGAYLFNLGAPTAKAVSLPGVNSFLNNHDDGLDVFSTGPITLFSVTASNNKTGYGIYLDNSTLGPAKPQNITLFSYAKAEGNYTSGLYVMTFGNIVGYNLNVNHNGTGIGASGAVLNNFLGASYLPRVMILYGTNSFKGNGYDGLYVITLGNVTLYNVNADDNDVKGVNISNLIAGGTGSASIMGTNSFSGNIDSGLSIMVGGNILIQDIDAVGNGNYGAYLNNVAGASSYVMVGTSRKDWCNLFSDNDSTGLHIVTNGAVTLSNICADWNGDPAYGLGVYVSNTSAATPKSVTLNGSNRFSKNYSGGLIVNSLGPITASGLNASENGGDGVYLRNSYNPSVPQYVILSGSNSFSSNAGYGLYVSSYGSITGSKITASGNLMGGAYLDNYSGLAVTPKSILLTGTNKFEGNGGTGMNAHSLGSITVYNLIATSNGGFGAYLVNNNANAVGTASLLGTSNLESNGVSGIEIWSRGTIAVQDINANENGGYGVFLNNAVSGTTGNVTLGTNRAYWCNSFNENYFSGLEIYSNGAVTLSNVCADSNGNVSSYGFGVYVENDSATAPKGVTLIGTVSTTYNFTGGVDVETRGPVAASNLYASANGGNGVTINNDKDTASPQFVTITGTNGFWANVDNGLEVHSYGTVQASNLESGWNGGSGVVLDNYGGVSIKAKPITLIGTNTFTENGIDGLVVTSWGAINAGKVTAIGNDGCGAFLDNSWGVGSAGGITLSGSNSFESNGVYGLNAISTGPVLINNLSVKYNEAYGVYIESIGATSPQKVSLTGTNNIIGNGNFGTHTGTGLVVMTDGQITINNLTVSGNAYGGAVLDNYTNWKSGTPGLTLTGTNAFDNNYDDGLFFNTVGVVTLNKVTADGNGGSGVYGLTNGKINITTASMTANGIYGWYLWCPDIVTLKGVFAYGNATNELFAGGGTLIKIRS